jgi:hypothetical protein
VSGKAGATTSCFGRGEDISSSCKRSSEYTHTILEFSDGALAPGHECLKQKPGKGCGQYQSVTKCAFVVALSDCNIVTAQLHLRAGDSTLCPTVPHASSCLHRVRHRLEHLNRELLGVTDLGAHRATQRSRADTKDDTGQYSPYVNI